MLDSDHLKKLMEQHNVTSYGLSKLTGISEQSIRNYSRGKTEHISSDTVGRLADIFCCSADYLMGRTDSPDTGTVSSEDLSRSVFERLYAGVSIKDVSPECSYDFLAGILSVWPYNLLEEIYGGREELDRQLCIPLSKDQMEGLGKALELLSEKDHDIVITRYKKGLTLDEAGRLYGVSRERVRQMAARAVRKLRHPAYLNLIAYGEKGSMIRAEERSAAAQEIKLDQRKAKLVEYSRKLDEFEAVLAERAEKNHILQDKIRKSGSDDIFDLELSVRAFNCLKRTGIATVSGLINFMAGHGEDWRNIRNLGIKSQNEIIEKLTGYTGYTYDEIMGGSARWGNSEKTEQEGDENDHISKSA